MVVETSRPIADVAREINVSETSLGNWVRDYRKSMPAKNRRWSCPSVPGCASWNGKTVSSA